MEHFYTVDIFLDGCFRMVNTLNGLEMFSNREVNCIVTSILLFSVGYVPLRL